MSSHRNIDSYHRFIISYHSNVVEFHSVFVRTNVDEGMVSKGFSKHSLGAIG